MPKLYVKEGWNKGAYYDIPEGKITIGRSSSCKVRVKDFDVSRVHAEIVMRESGTVTIRDLQSKNGTLVNDSVVEEANLKAGDEARVGNTVFVFMTDESTDLGSGLDLTEKADEPPAAMQTIIGIQQSSLFEGKEGVKEEGTRALQRAKENLKLLNEIHQGIISELELSRVLEKIMDIVFEKMSPDQGFILLLDEKTGKLVPRFSRDKRGQTSFSDIGVSRTIINRALKDEVAILSQDVFGAGQEQAVSIVQFNIKSAMCVPLKAKDHILGILQVHNRLTSPDFTQDDLELLTAICNMTAMAIENAKLYQEVQKEVKRRGDLSKYFSPQLVEQLMEGKLAVETRGKKEQLSILFSDIRGFTTLSADMQPDLLVEMLNEHLSTMTNVLFKYQGFLSKFIGDGIMAVFTIPRAHPDDAQRAVRAALEMQERNKALNERFVKEGRKPFPMGIGVNSGDAMIGNVGGEQLEFAILGDCVNVASRLCSKAKADQVLISRSTRDSLPDTFEFTGPMHLEVKGKKEPIETYEVVRELPDFSV